MSYPSGPQLGFGSQCTSDREGRSEPPFRTQARSATSWNVASTREVSRFAPWPCSLFPEQPGGFCVSSSTSRHLHLGSIPGLVLRWHLMWKLTGCQCPTVPTLAHGNSSLPGPQIPNSLSPPLLYNFSSQGGKLSKPQFWPAKLSSKPGYDH